MRMASNGHFYQKTELCSVSWFTLGINFDAETTTDAKLFGNERNFGSGCHLNAQFPCKDTAIVCLYRAKIEEWVPVFTTGQHFRHSCLHFFGLHLTNIV